MRNFLKTNLYQALQQISLLTSGGIIGFAITKILEGWNLSCTQTVWIVIAFLAFSLFGLGYGVFFFYPYIFFNQKLKRVAIFAPYEIKDDATSSWVDVSLKDFIASLRKQSIRIQKTDSLFASRLYPVIINPYGGAYPEEDLKDNSHLNQICEWVQDGGVYINIADFPFYYAKTSAQNRLIDTTPLAGHFSLLRSFLESLLVKKLGVQTWGIDPKDGVERVFDIHSTIKNLWNENFFVHPDADTTIKRSPVILLPYGRGCFIFSSIRVKANNLDHIVGLVRKAFDFIES